MFYTGSHTLESVYRNSKAESQQVFRKPIFSEDSYTTVYAKTKIPFQAQQKECLKLVCTWTVVLMMGLATNRITLLTLFSISSTQ